MQYLRSQPSPTVGGTNEKKEKRKKETKIEKGKSEEAKTSAKRAKEKNGYPTYEEAGGCSNRDFRSPVRAYLCLSGPASAASGVGCGGCCKAASQRLSDGAGGVAAIDR